MNPLDHYRQVQSAFVRGDSGFRLPRHPFVNAYQPSQALRALAVSPRSHGAFVFKQSASGEAPLSEMESWPAGRFPNLAVSCQLALLWAILARLSHDAALRSAAHRLAGFLLPILEGRLTALWTVPREYRAEELSLSANLLQRAVGKPFCAGSLQSIGEEGFFSFLYTESDPNRETPLFASHALLHYPSETLVDAELGYQLFRTENAAWALTSKGWQTPAGALRMGDIDIPAFGPHGAPLSDPQRFGIGSGEAEWFCCFDMPKSWFRIEPLKTNKGEIAFVLHSVGVSADQPVAFALYVRADECHLAGRICKPNHLQRLSADSSSMILTSKKTTMKLSIDKPAKVEVIPLAGGSEFWGASFLIAIWLSPLDSKKLFTIQPFK